MKQGWEIKKLGEVCTIERGGSPRPIQAYLTDSDDGVNWIKIGDAIEGSKYITSTKEKIKPEGVKKSRFVKKGDFILSNSMSFGRPYILAVDGCIHDGWLVIHDENNYFNKNYLYYYLGSPNIYKEFQRLAVGGVVNNLNSEIVRNVNVSIPPLAEQERIVAELDCLSGVIEKKKQQLKELDALAQSIFYEMFGDPITNEKGWEVKYLSSTIDEECPISYGIVQPKEDVEDGVPIVRPIDLGDTFVQVKGLKKTSKEISNAYKRTILRGDEILMCVRGTTGIVSLATDKLSGCNTTRGIVPLYFTKMNRWFMFYVFKNPAMINLISDYTYGTTLKQINIRDLRQLPIISPPLKLQQEFASKIELIETQKELIKQSIKETETLFNSRMDYYFN